MTTDCYVTKEFRMVVVLSGYLPNDILSFWRTFIELQARLPTNKVVTEIIAHSLNPELTDLIWLTYAPKIVQYDECQKYYDNITRRIDAGSLNVSQDSPINLAMQSESVRTTLCNAFSRASAIRLLDKLPAQNCQVLMAYWDLMGSDSTQLNQIVTDPSLPLNYLYLSYSSDVEMGYSDSWILASWEIARRFCDFDQFVLDAFMGKNNYLEYFLKTGWPYSQSQPYYRSILLPLIVRKLRSASVKSVRDALISLEGNLRGDNFFRRILRRLLRPIYLFLTQPLETAENSCLVKSRRWGNVFSESLAINIRPLLKYFVIFNKMRDRVRFLTTEDFEIVGQSGQIINPQHIILVVFESGDISLQLSSSPFPIAAVYQVADGRVQEYFLDGAGNWSSTIIQPIVNTLKGQLHCVLSAAESRTHIPVPLLIVSSVSQYLKCVDWFYLNALMKFSVWKELDYVSLASTIIGKSYLEFPDILIVQNNTLSLFPSLGSISGIRRLLDNPNFELSAEYELKGTVAIQFLATSKIGNLFENLECAYA